MAERTRLPLYGLMVATVIGLIGRQLSVVAIPWFVLSTTGSAARAGLVGAVVFLPGVFVGIFGGVLVDRLGYKRVSIASDVVCALATMMIPLLYTTVGLAFWQLLVLVFFSSLLDIPALTARRSMVPEMAKLAGMSLDRVNAMFESLQNLSGLLGTPIAGLLVAWLGARHVLWLDATASAISGLIVLITVPGAMFVRHVASAHSGYWADVKTGLRFIRHDEVLWPMVIVLALTNALTSATAGVILPVYFKEEYGSAASLGLVLAAMGGGAFLGTVAYGAFAGRVSRRTIWVASYLIAPLEFWIFLISPPVALLAAAYLVVGFAMGPINPIMVTLRHERSPLAIRGRVFSTYSAIAMSASPVGILVAGNMIDGVGFDPTLVVFAVAAQVIGGSSLLIPGFRKMDAAPLHPVVAEAAPMATAGE